MSPILVKDFHNPKKYIESEKEVEENLNLITKWQMKNLLKFDADGLEIHLDEVSRKTVRISSNNDQVYRTTGFNVSGEIISDPLILKAIYYKGLGSKTGLGLGCIEVIN